MMRKMSFYFRVVTVPVTRHISTNTIKKSFLPKRERLLFEENWNPKGVVCSTEVILPHPT